MRRGIVVVLAVAASCAHGEPAAPAASRAEADSAADGTVEWETPTPPSSPQPRFGAALAYDAARAKTVLFGGYFTPDTSLDETWTWDGAAWAQAEVTPRPSARTAHAMTYDAARGEVVLFGGQGCAAFGCLSIGDTWTWDGAAWALKQPLTSPSARHSAAMAFDAARAKVVLFGGCTADCSAPTADTWEWDGSDWAQVTPQRAPDPRSSASMTFDGSHVLLYGGQMPAFPPKAFGDTWLFDGASWTLLAPPHAPSARSGAGLTYDAARRRVVLYAGAACFGLCSLYDELWEWNGTDWNERSPALVFSKGADTLTAYDAARRRTVMTRVVGGEPLAVYELAGYAERCARDDDCDTAHCNGGICCKVACGTCSDCASTGDRCVAVRGQDDAESCNGDVTCDLGAACRSKLGRPCKSADDCASGACTGGVCCSSPVCGAYACDAQGACRTSCATDGDCAPGAACVDRACVPVPAACDGNDAVARDGTRTTCAPFACGAAGCQTSCASSDDCAPGFACDRAQRCVAPPAEAALPSCSGAPARPSRGAWLVVALLALVRRRAR
jgi:hypothetical protein